MVYSLLKILAVKTLDLRPSELHNRNLVFLLDNSHCIQDKHLLHNLLFINDSESKNVHIN